MAFGQYDGSIRIDTRIDNSGFEKGLEQQTTSLKSQAAKRAAIYRKEGMSQSEAMKKAWSEIERTSVSATSNIAKRQKGIALQNLQFEKGLNKITQSVKRFGAAVGTAFGVTALIKFGKEAVNLASDVQEAQNVVDTAFGAMSGMVEKFADTAIEKYGMSELAAKQTASTYMAMSKGMGMYGEQAAQMSIDAAARTGDIASFYNMTQKEADTMLKSIWTGETESLKRIGVVMTQTNLDQYALQKGFGKTTSAMNQQELVMLRYQYVMEQTGLAAGDFEKTQDSWANQTRVLSERWKQFLSLMGTGLIQLLTPALKFLNQMMSVLIRFADAFSKVTAAIFGKQTLNTAAGTAAATESAAGATDEYADAVANAKKKQDKFLAGLDEITTLNEQNTDSASASAPMGAGNVSVPALSGEIGGDVTISPALQKTMDSLTRFCVNLKSYFEQFAPTVKKAAEQMQKPLEKFKSFFKRMLSDIKSLGNPLQEWAETDLTGFIDTLISTSGNVFGGFLDTVGTVFGSLWNTTVFPSLQTFANHILPFFTQLGTESVSTFGVAFGEIKTIFDKVWTEGVAPVLSSLQTKWNEVWSILSEKWETYGKPIFEQLRAAWVNISNTVQTVWDKFIKPVWDSFMTAIDWLWDEHLAPFVDKLTDMLGKLISGALEIYNKVISPIVEWVLTVLLPPIRGAVQLIISICTSVFATITDIVSGIIRTISGIIDFVVGVFTGDWERAWNGIKDIFGGIFDSVKSTFTGVINVIIDAINFLFKKGTNVINKVINGLNRIHFTIPDWVPALGGKSLGFNISTLTEYQIPRLATGAVIPPNAEFAAILGDQKHGRNLEAPESLIRKIVKEESGAQLTVILQMPDGSQKTVFDTKAIKKTNRQSGKIIIPVEV